MESNIDKTQVERRKDFIKYLILGLIILLFASVATPLIISNHFTVSSIEPEIVALKEILKKEKKKHEKCLAMMDILLSECSLEKDKLKPIDTARIAKYTALVKKELLLTNSEAIEALIAKIESKTKNIIRSSETPEILNWIKTIFGLPLLGIILIIAMVYFRFTLKDLKDLFGKVKSVSIMGNSIEFGDEARIEAENSISEYRSYLNKLIESQVLKERLDDKLRNLHEDLELYLKSFPTNNPSENFNIRCTIHIQDLLFKDTLYQLLNYYPIQKERSAGRIKSIRFGIIGLAWRSEISKIRGNVENNRQDLISKWGLDISEVGSDSSRKSFAAIVLKTKGNNTRFGVLYFDSPILDLFGDLSDNREPYLIEKAEDFERKVLDICTNREIIESIENIKNNLSDKFLQIDIYDYQQK